MTLAAAVVEHLARRGIPCAVIGGAALAVHGIARATVDLDLLAAESTVLEPRSWQGFGDPPSEIRRGDSDDPIDGVVRFRRDEEVVEVVVGTSTWMRQIVGRSEPRNLGGESLPVVNAADLILLKLYAAGPQDLLDVRLLLAALPAVAGEVDDRIGALPAEVRAAWREQFGAGRG